MKTLNEMFSSKYILLVKYLVASRMTYLEQKHVRLSNHADIHHWQ